MSTADNQNQMPLPPGGGLRPKTYDMPPPPRMFSPNASASGGAPPPPPPPPSMASFTSVGSSLPRPPGENSIPSSVDNTPMRGGGPPRPPMPYDPSASANSGSTAPAAVLPPPRPQQQPPMMTPGQAERERVAEEAIMQSLNHAVHRYIRQDVADSLGVDEHGKPLASHNLDGGRHPLEFHPGPPKHNIRIIAVLAIALFGLLPLIGHAALTVAILGCGSVYIADFLGYRKGSVLVMFCALGSFEGVLLLTNLYQAYNSLGAMLALINTVVVACTIAATSMLQYKWLQITFPELVIFLERLVLVVAPLSTIPSLLATSVALSGSRLGIFPFTLCMCGLHYLFATPRFSSFLRRPQEDLDDEQNSEDAGGSSTLLKEEDVALHATARGDAAILTAILYLIPMVSMLMIQSQPLTSNLSMIIMTWSAIAGIFSMYLLSNPSDHLWFLKPKTNTLTGMMEDDPLGVYTIITKYRDPVMFAGYLLLMEGFIYRLLHSRFQYLFVGLAPPMNGMLLMVVGLLISIVVLMSMRVLRLSELLSNSSASPAIPLMSQSRLIIMLLCIVAAVLVAVVTGMPPVFHPLSAIAAATFNAFLMDRKNGSGFMLFVFSSSILLLWWMYRTFSFVIMDLRILADGTVIPSSVMTVSILLCYLLGALSFGFSFNENKRPFAVVLCMLAFKLAFVEHILYSQRDTGVYPGFLVIATSLAGAGTAIKLFRNEVLGVEAAALVIGAFTSKIYTFLYEQTAVTYILDSEGRNTLSGVRAFLLSIGWVTTFVACSIISFLEMQHQGKDRVRIQTLLPGLLSTFIMASFTAFACAYGSITRAFVEAISFRWMSVTNEVDALVGGVILLTTIVTFPIISRYTSRSALSDCMIPFGISLGVLLVSPFSFINGVTLDSATDDSSYDTTPFGRTLIMVVIVLIAIGRLVPFYKAPAVVRDGYWVIICAITAVAMHLVMHPACSFLTTITFFFFMSLIGISVDLAHYRKEVGMELFVVFGCAVAAMILQFLAVGRMDFYSTPGLESADGTLIWDLQVNTRMTVLSTASVAFMLLGVFTHFRVTGNSLLPHTTGLTIESIQNVAVVGNYATLLSVVLMLVLNFTIGEGNLAMYVAICSFLLMLVEDDMLCIGLSQEGFRYFPVLMSLLAVYWATMAHNIYEIWTRETSGLAIATALYATPVLPSHISLLWLLYNGTKKGGIVMASVLIFVVIDLVCILFTTNAVVQWMAIVGITGQMARLYVGKFWAHSIGTIV